MSIDCPSSFSFQITDLSFYTCEALPDEAFPTLSINTCLQPIPVSNSFAESMNLINYFDKVIKFCDFLNASIT